MIQNFIRLTTKDNKPVIIEISNVGLIEKIDSKKENSESIIKLNFARNKGLRPKTIIVTESFDQLKSVLGL